MEQKRSSPLYLALVLLALGSLFHASSTEPVNDLFHRQIGLRSLQGSKATPTSDATTQTTHADESEFVHPGTMGFVLNDYPTSGANSRHSSYPGGNR
ncbi:hypothetical protein ACP70R_033121 [Stipagrostis hirtigluma subsp. patula]